MWAWIAFTALWVLGIAPAYIVADECMNSSHPVLIAVAWPFTVIVGMGVVAEMNIRNFIREKL